MFRPEKPVMAVGMAVVAAQPVSFFTVSFSLLPWMDRRVSRTVVTRSRRLSVHSVARSTWS